MKNPPHIWTMKTRGSEHYVYRNKMLFGIAYTIAEGKWVVSTPARVVRKGQKTYTTLLLALKARYGAVATEEMLFDQSKET